MCAVSLIQKRCYWLKLVPGDLIYTHFEDNEVGDVGMLEAITQDNKLFRILCMKDTDYVMKIISIWIKLYELYGTKTRRDFIDRNGTKGSNCFTYQHPFGLNLRYRYKVYDHKNLIHAPISL